MLFRLCLIALFQSTTAFKIDSEHIPDCMKLLSVCKVEIFQAAVNKIEVVLSFYVDFC